MDLRGRRALQSTPATAPAAGLVALAPGPAGAATCKSSGTYVTGH